MGVSVPALVSASRLAILLALSSLIVAGCNCGIIEDPGPCAVSPELCAAIDAGRGGGRPDAGPRRDSGYTDGGRVWNEFAFPSNTAYEPCSAESIANAVDSGYQEGDVYLPLCIALREVKGNAKLNGQNVTSGVQWTWGATGFSSEYDDSPDQNGDYKVDVLRASYSSMTWHPSAIFPTHSGPLGVGAIDLRENRTKDLSTRSYQLSGNLTFGGLPWLFSMNPPDTQLMAANQAYQQSATTSNSQGNYVVRMVEGSYQLFVSVPPEGLGTTELIGYPLGTLALNADTTVNKDLPVSQLTGTVKLDGAAIPARAQSGPDWLMEYEQAGTVVAVTRHEGNETQIRAMLPKGVYDLNLGFPTGTDRTLPAYLYHRRLAAAVNLNQDAVLNVDMPTRTWEGALLVDGQPVPQNAGGVWTLYAFGYGGGIAGTPWFVAYYDVPFTSSAFALRMFPDTYYTQVYIDERFHPDLMAGWYTHERQLEVLQHISSIIDIPTAELTGTILIDGVPATATSNVGALTLAGSSGTYRRKIDTTDGTFKVRVPKGTYEVSFNINEDVYGEYATGRFVVTDSLTLDSRSNITIDYRTVRVSGPLAVKNAPVPNTNLATAELGLRLSPWGVASTWTKRIEGGKGWYSFRIPEGDWDIDVRIEERALPGTAWGVAPYADAYPMRPQR